MSLDSKVITFSNSKVRKGKLEEAMKTLQKLRGSSYRGVEEEVAFSHHFSLTLHCFLPSSFHNFFLYLFPGQLWAHSSGF